MPRKVKKSLEPTAALQETPTSTSVTKTREDLEAEVEDRLRRVCGVKTPQLAHALTSQVAHLQVWTRPDPANQVAVLTRAISLLGELDPGNGSEAMLAVQMIGVHEAATEFLHRANAPEQTIDGADRNVVRATRLMRLFNEQLTAMARLKGRTSQQRVVVEHVHVHRGGQAIVGAVEAPKPQLRREPDPNPETNAG